MKKIQSLINERIIESNQIIIIILTILYLKGNITTNAHLCIKRKQCCVCMCVYVRRNIIIIQR